MSRPTQQRPPTSLLQARPRPVITEAVSPASVLAGVEALLDHRFARAGVRLSVEASAVAPVAADAGQLEQVLVNLLINACDACGDGYQVEVDAFGDGGMTY